MELRARRDGQHATGELLHCVVHLAGFVDGFVGARLDEVAQVAVERQMLEAAYHIFVSSVESKRWINCGNPGSTGGQPAPPHLEVGDEGLEGDDVARVHAVHALAHHQVNAAQ